MKLNTLNKSQIKALQDYIFNTAACETKVSEVIRLLEVFGLELHIAQKKGA